MQSDTCPRGRADCMPLNNIISDEEPRSFVCCGYNDPSTREIAQDRFTVCWKNEAVDERGYWDKRDITDHIAVLSQALSIDGNIQCAEALTDQQMNEMSQTFDRPADDGPI